MKQLVLSAFILSFCQITLAQSDYLVKLSAKGQQRLAQLNSVLNQSSKVEQVSPQWVRVQPKKGAQFSSQFLAQVESSPLVEYIQPNYKIKLIEEYKVEDKIRRELINRYLNSLKNTVKLLATGDNPAIPAAPAKQTGADPLLEKQWGMLDIGVQDAWKITTGNPAVTVAVIDTGVDYTHPDLLPNLWRNKGETGLDANGKDKTTNGIDDDANGYIDDTIGWDFVSNDNKPYDYSLGLFDVVLNGGNPGHGTHCAGNVAAKGSNGIGIAGVAPDVTIMSLRFISEKGQGTTADAIKAINYAVANGAKVMSNSWGSEGEDSSEESENKALRDTIQMAQDKGVLFIAAAGNGHQGKGYDNDTDKAPAYPASYDHDIIISVAATDVNDQLGPFSNWGLKSVDIGAPGVKVFSTTVGGNYSDMVLDLGPSLQASWDGTSMATPHVAGAAALYWSAHPTKTWQEVKAAILGSAKKISSMAGKSTSGGKLDVKALMLTN